MNDSGFFNAARHIWYLLILPVIWGINLFYQVYYDTRDRFILITLIKAYSKSGFTELPIHIYISVSVFTVLLCLIIFFNPFQALYDKNRVHGSARFARFRDIKKLGLLNGKGMVLCKWQRRTLCLSQPLSVLLLAPPGTFKTTGVAIPTLFQSPNSIIALDVKKELFQITSKHRSTFSRVMIFEPTSPATSRWNPLDARILPPTFAERFVTIQNIAMNIFTREPSETPFWIDSARDIFLNVAVALVHRDGGTTIPDVHDATLPNGEASVKDTLYDLGCIDGLYSPVAQKLKSYRGIGDDQFGSMHSTFTMGLKDFIDPRVRYAVSACDIVFKDFRGVPDENNVLLPVTLYLVIRPDDVDRLSPLIRVFFETLTKHLLSVEWDKKTERQITFLLDEFPRLGKMEDLIKSPALSRGQGFNSIIIAQDAGQIERIYERTGREEIMSTTAYKIIPSQNSFESAKLISDTIGDMTVKTASDSRTNNTFFGGSRSFREQGKKLLSPQKIMSLKPGKCFVISQFAAETPIKAELATWFKDRRMKKLAGEIPDDQIYRPGVNSHSALSAQSQRSAPSERSGTQVINVGDSVGLSPVQSDGICTETVTSDSVTQRPLADPSIIVSEPEPSSLKYDPDISMPSPEVIDAYYSFDDTDLESVLNRLNGTSDDSLKTESPNRNPSARENIDFSTTEVSSVVEDPGTGVDDVSSSPDPAPGSDNQRRPDSNVSITDTGISLSDDDSDSDESEAYSSERAERFLERHVNALF